MMRQNTYNTHQKILGSVLIAYGAINFTGGLILLAAMNVVQIFVHEMDVVQLVTIFSRLIGIILLVVSIPAIVAGIGQLTIKEWSKNLSLIVGILYLLFFPIGTVIGIYAIWLNSQQIVREKEPMYATDLVKGATT